MHFLCEALVEIVHVNLRPIVEASMGTAYTKRPCTWGDSQRSIPYLSGGHVILDNFLLASTSKL